MNFLWLYSCNPPIPPAIVLFSSATRVFALQLVLKINFPRKPRRILLSKYLDSYLVFFHSCGLIVGFFNNFFWLITESYTHVPHAPKAASLFLPRLIPACCYEIGSLSIYLMKQNKKEKQRTTNRYNTTFSWKPTHIRAGRVVRAEANMTCIAPDFEIL